MKKEQKQDKRRNVWYVISGAAIMAGICVIMPKLIEKGADYFYTKSKTHYEAPDYYDWNPEIVKKSSLEVK